MIKLIVAYDKNQLIGINDKLAWNIKEDLEHFKKETLNKTILFGDVTFKGIGKSLPNRKIIILSFDKKLNYEYENVFVCNDINEIINKYHNNDKEEIIVAGGATIYKLFLPYVDQIILSEIKNEYNGNVFFPKWDQSKFDLIKIEDKKEFTIKIFNRKE